MEISRRDFLRFSVATGSATALGGLIGSGVNLGPVVARAQELRIKGAKITPSVCPYCSVGCATLIHTIDGKVVNIEGDPRSPHNEGALCPKGAAIFQLHVNPNRPIQVLHRSGGATEWEVWDLNRAMDRVAELVKKTRDETFVEKLQNGKLVNFDHGDLFSRRRHARLRMESYPTEAHARARHRTPSRTRPGYDTALASPVWGRDSVAAPPPCIRAAWQTPIASSSWVRIWRKIIRWRFAGR